jgi:TP901-1 family phage major tail protein
MSAKRGRDVLLQIQVGAAWQTLGGMQVTSLTLRNAFTETNRTRWRETLAGRGQQALRVSARGLFEDSASEATVRAAAFAKSALPFRLWFGNGDLAAGTAIVTDYEAAGTVDGLETYAVTLEATGPVTLTPAG